MTTRGQRPTVQTQDLNSVSFLSRHFSVTYSSLPPSFKINYLQHIANISTRRVLLNKGMEATDGRRRRRTEGLLETKRKVEDFAKKIGLPIPFQHLRVSSHACLNFFSFLSLPLPLSPFILVTLFLVFFTVKVS